MDLKEVIEKRASVRQFAADPVPAEHLREIVRLAGRAPSINNSQPWRFIAITNRDLLKSLAGAVRGKVEEMLPVCNDEEERRAKSQVEWFSTFFEEAPAVIAVAVCPYQAIVDKALPHTNLNHDDLNAMRGHPDIESIGASIQNLMLAAVDLGYGTCWLSGPLIARESLEERLGVEQPWRLAAMIAVGKPAHITNQREKKPVDEIFELID